MNKSKNKKNSPKKKKITYQPTPEFDSVLLKEKKNTFQSQSLPAKINKNPIKCIQFNLTNNNDQINEPCIKCLLV